MQAEARDKRLKTKTMIDGHSIVFLFIYLLFIFSLPAEGNNNAELYQVSAGLHKEKTPSCFMKLIYLR